MYPWIFNHRRALSLVVYFALTWGLTLPFYDRVDLWSHGKAFLIFLPICITIFVAREILVKLMPTPKEIK